MELRGKDAVEPLDVHQRIVSDFDRARLAQSNGAKFDAACYLLSAYKNARLCGPSGMEVFKALVMPGDHVLSAKFGASAFMVPKRGSDGEPKPFDGQMFHSAQAGGLHMAVAYETAKIMGEDTYTYTVKEGDEERTIVEKDIQQRYKSEALERLIFAGHVAAHLDPTAFAVLGAECFTFAAFLSEGRMEIRGHAHGALNLLNRLVMTLQKQEPPDQGVKDPKRKADIAAEWRRKNDALAAGIMAEILQHERRFMLNGFSNDILSEAKRAEAKERVGLVAAGHVEQSAIQDAVPK